MAAELGWDDDPPRRGGGPLPAPGRGRAAEPARPHRPGGRRGPGLRPRHRVTPNPPAHPPTRPPTRASIPVDPGLSSCRAGCEFRSSRVSGIPQPGSTRHKARVNQNPRPGSTRPKARVDQTQGPGRRGPRRDGWLLQVCAGAQLDGYPAGIRGCRLSLRSGCLTAPDHVGTGDPGVRGRERHVRVASTSRIQRPGDRSGRHRRPGDQPVGPHPPGPGRHPHRGRTRRGPAGRPAGPLLHPRRAHARRSPRPSRTGPPPPTSSVSVTRSSSSSRTSCATPTAPSTPATTGPTPGCPSSAATSWSPSRTTARSP